MATKKTMGNGCTRLAGCDLPGDLVIEILSRLPVKSLLKFNTICKLWNALTKDPIFITNHVKKNLSSPLTDENTNTVVEYYKPDSFDKNIALFCYKTLRQKVVFESPSFGRELKSVQVRGQCNGIVCLSLAFNDQDPWSARRHHDLALWNPATRDVKLLPISNARPRLPGGFSSYSNIILLGHDPTTDDYKVVMILQGRLVSTGKYAYDHEEPLYYKEFGILAHRINVKSSCVAVAERVEVYSLNKNAWEVVEPEKRVTEDYCKRLDHVYLNGFCYWLKRGSAKHKQTVMSFDMTNEVFSEIGLPPEIDEHVLLKGRDLFITNGSSLCIGTRRVGDKLRIWAMVDEKGEGGGSTRTNKGWIRRSDVDLSTYYNVRLTRENGDVIVQYFDDGKLRLDESSTNITVEPLDILSPPDFDKILICPATLVWLKTA